MVLTQLEGLNLKVIGKDHSFPYHYGSHATLEFCCWKCLAKYGFHTTMVLTQLAKYARRRDRQDSFHTTMVLTQPVLWRIRLEILHRSFHTTMVLTQLYRTGLTNQDLIKFPYHYGSHATQLIPRTTLLATWGFHTTMVLTQQCRNYGQKKK